MPKVTLTNNAGTPLANDTATELPVKIASATSSVNVIPTTTISMNVLESAATTNATLVKATGGSLISLILTNTSATTKYVKLYNKGSLPTVGTDIPTMVFAVPATSTVSHSFGFGARFTAGLSYAVTSLMPNSDTTAVGAGDIKIHLTYN